MENSPPAASSLEKQIDNFLEHFKRSASKAMEAEWCNIGGNSNTTGGGGCVTGSSTTTTVANTTTTSNTTSTSESISSQTPSLPTPKQMSFEKHQHLLQRTRSRSSCLDLNNMMMGKFGNYTFNVTSRLKKIFPEISREKKFEIFEIFKEGYFGNFSRF